jgi:uncharacterized OB-fold protein
VHGGFVTTPPTTPLPNVDDPLSRPFWTATGEGRLVTQRCQLCGYLRFPPAPICPECLAEETEWTEIAPTGTLYSFATYHRALDPAFRAEVPYTIGYIELDAGPRMIGTVVGDPVALVVGAPVHAVFDEVAPGVTLVRWQLVDAPPSASSPA